MAGKVVLVTGASRGIGAAIAERFAAEGAAVGLVARTMEPGGSLPGSVNERIQGIRDAGGTAVGVQADLADPATDRAAIVATVRDQLGPIDVLVNNAAACFYLPFPDTSERRLRVATEANYITPYLLAQACLPDWLSRGAGWLLNITSGMAVGNDGPPWEVDGNYSRSTTYGPTKAALNRLTTSLAAELWPHGIAVNALAPTKAVRTEGATAMMDLPDEWLEPMDQMVDAALVLATADPATLTGQVLTSEQALGMVRARQHPN